MCYVKEEGGKWFVGGKKKSKILPALILPHEMTLNKITDVVHLQPGDKSSFGSGSSHSSDLLQAWAEDLKGTLKELMRLF